MMHRLTGRLELRLLCLGLILLLLGCKSQERPSAQVFGDVGGAGDEHELEGVDLGPYLALARAALSGRDTVSIPGLEARPGRRVFLTVYQPEAKDVVTTGLGKSLADSVVTAAQLGRSITAPVEAVRLQLDVVTIAEGVKLNSSLKPEPAQIGSYGFAMSRERKLGFVLPGEIVTRELYQGGKNVGIKRKGVVDLIAKRARASARELDDFKTFRIETRSVLESQPPGRVLSLRRGMVERREAPGAGELVSANRDAADYLVRVLDPRGRYIYNYLPVQDKDGGGYNMLRHCGTTYALLEAYEEHRDPRYLEAAERAILYLEGRLQPRPDWVEVKPGVGDFIHLVDEEKGQQSKVGGAGLALIALTKHAAVTGQATWLETMRGMARFILHMQEENGHFLSYFQYRKDQKETQKEVLYYPGEAMLGLLRLYAFDPDPRWLAAARKGADYLIDVRDKRKTEDDLEHDHWLSMALNELYRVTKETRYAEHAFKISRAIMQKQKTREEGPADFVGSFYKLPNSTPAAVRLEAYAADITLARFMGRSDKELIAAAVDVASFVRAQQFDAQNSAFLARPAKALGGVRESIARNDIRIDYVQHAMSGMLGLARALRDPAWGKTGVPAVIPVKPLRGKSTPMLEARAGGAPGSDEGAGGGGEPRALGQPDDVGRTDGSAVKAGSDGGSSGDSSDSDAGDED